MPAMLTPRMGQVPPDGQAWGADTGRYNSPDEYSDELYLKWLERMEPYRDRCLFATAPDVVGDHEKTWELSRYMFNKIRMRGYRVALVAQDGLTVEWLADDGGHWWNDFDVLFIGGTTAWKLGEDARALCAEAKRRGKWVHMGRVNSFRRLKIAQSFGCDSVDGTYIAFGPDINEPKVHKWLERLAA